MTSHKRRTTSKSGASARSKKTGPSQPTKSSSQTAQAWLDTFGIAPTKEEARLRQLRAAATDRLAALEAITEPKLPLYRAQHRARLQRERRLLKQLDEAILAAKTPTD